MKHCLWCGKDHSSIDCPTALSLVDQSLSLSATASTTLDMESYLKMMEGVKPSVPAHTKEDVDELVRAIKFMLERFSDGAETRVRRALEKFTG